MRRVILAVVGLGLLSACARQLHYEAGRLAPKESLDGLHAVCANDHDCGLGQACRESSSLLVKSCEVSCEEAGEFKDELCPPSTFCVRPLTFGDMPVGTCWGPL
jgi:hypothetical protein